MIEVSAMDNAAYNSALNYGRMNYEMNQGNSYTLAMSDNDNYLQRLKAGGISPQQTQGSGNSGGMRADLEAKGWAPWAIDTAKFVGSMGAGIVANIGARFATSRVAAVVGAGIGTAVGGNTAAGAAIGGLTGFVLGNAAGAAAQNFAATAFVDKFEGEDFKLDHVSGKNIFADTLFNVIPGGLAVSGARKGFMGAFARFGRTYEHGRGWGAFGARVGYNAAVTPLQNKYTTGEYGSLGENLAMGVVGGVAEHGFNALQNIKGSIPKSDQGNLNIQQPVNPGDNRPTTGMMRDIEMPKQMQPQAPQTPQNRNIEYPHPATPITPPIFNMSDDDLAINVNRTQGYRPELGDDVDIYLDKVNQLQKPLQESAAHFEQTTTDALKYTQFNKLDPQDIRKLREGLDEESQDVFGKLKCAYDYTSKQYTAKSSSKLNELGGSKEELIDTAAIDMFPDKPFKVTGVDRTNKQVSVVIEAADYNAALKQAQKDFAKIDDIKAAPKSKSRQKLEKGVAKQEVKKYLDDVEFTGEERQRAMINSVHPAITKLSLADQKKLYEQEMLKLLQTSKNKHLVQSYADPEVIKNTKHYLEMARFYQAHVDGAHAKTRIEMAETARQSADMHPVMTNPILDTVHGLGKQDVGSKAIQDYNTTRSHLQQRVTKSGLYDVVNGSAKSEDSVNARKARDAFHTMMIQEEYKGTYYHEAHNDVYSKYGAVAPWNYDNVSKGRKYRFRDPGAEVLQSAARHVDFMKGKNNVYFKHQEVAFKEMKGRGWSDDAILAQKKLLDQAVKDQTVDNRSSVVEFSPEVPDGAHMPNMPEIKEQALLASLKMKADAIDKLQDVTAEEITQVARGIDKMTPMEERLAYRDAKAAAQQLGDADTLERMEAIERLVTNGFEPVKLEDRELTNGYLLSEALEDTYSHNAEVIRDDDGDIIVRFDKYTPNAAKVQATDMVLDSLKQSAESVEMNKRTITQSRDPVEINQATFKNVENIASFFDVVTQPYLNKYGQTLNFKNTYALVFERAAKLHSKRSSVQKAVKAHIGEPIDALPENIKAAYVEVAVHHEAINILKKTFKDTNDLSTIPPGQLWDTLKDIEKSVLEGMDFGQTKVKELTYKKSLTIKNIFKPTEVAVSKYKDLLVTSKTKEQGEFLAEAHNTLLNSHVNASIDAELQQLMIVPSSFSDNTIMRNFTSMSRVARGAASLSTTFVNAIQTKFMGGQLVESAYNLRQAEFLKEHGYPIDKYPLTAKEEAILKDMGKTVSIKQVFGLDEIAGVRDVELGTSQIDVETGLKGFVENASQFVQRWAAGTLRDQAARKSFLIAKDVANAQGFSVDSPEFKEIFDVEYSTILQRSGESNRALLSTANVVPIKGKRAIDGTIIDPSLAFNALNSWANFLDSKDSPTLKALGSGIKFANENILHRWVRWFPEELARQKNIYDMNSKAGDIFKEAGFEDVGNRIKYGNSITTIAVGSGFFGGAYAVQLASMATMANVMLGVVGAIQNEEGDVVESARENIDKYDLKGKLGQLNMFNLMLKGTGGPALDGLDMNKFSVDPAGAFAIFVGNMKAIANNIADVGVGLHGAARDSKVDLRKMRGDIGMLRTKLDTIGMGIKAFEDGDIAKGWADVIQGITGLVGYGAYTKQISRAVAASKGFIYVPSKASVYDQLKYGFSYAGGKMDAEEADRVESNNLYRLLYSGMVFMGAGDKENTEETRRSFEVSPVDRYVGILNQL